MTSRRPDADTSTDSIDPHNDAKATSAAGLHSRQRVLEHGGARGLHAECLSRPQEGVGRRLAPQVFARRHYAVDDFLDEIDDSSRGQDVPAVGARGDHGAA